MELKLGKAVFGFLFSGAILTTALVMKGTIVEKATTTRIDELKYNT